MKPKLKGVSGVEERGGGYDLPFAKASLQVDDRLGALNVTETHAPDVQHLIGSLWEQATDVDVSLARLVLQAAIERLHGRARCRNGAWDRWVLDNHHLDMDRRGDGRRVFVHWGNIWMHVLQWRRSAGVSVHSVGRAIDDSDTIVATLKCVRSSGDRLIVGGHGATARSDEGWHAWPGRSIGGNAATWRQRLTVRAVVCTATVARHWLHVLRDTSVQIVGRVVAGGTGHRVQDLLRLHKHSLLASIAHLRVLVTYSWHV